MNTYCPYCKKEVKYIVEKREVKEFKGVEINTYENVAVCTICKNDLYVNTLEDENILRINELYRNATNIIKPDDIIKFREKYNISQRELTSILNFGKMTINRYERGAVPTKSQSDYIKLLIDNENEFLNKVTEAFEKKYITKKTFDKIISIENNDRVKTKSEFSTMDIQEYYRIYLMKSLEREPDIYNGYQTFDLELVENIISYISSKVKNLTLTSLNKYLWFIDCISFKRRGISITGISYQKQKYGPTIIDKRYTELSLLDDKYTRNDYEDETGTKTFISSKKNYDLSSLKPNEKKIIDYVINILKDKSVKEISDLSHKEDGWTKTKELENISFEYALNLKIDE